MLKIYFLFLSLIWSFSVYAQNKTNLLVSENGQKILKEMNLEIYIPQDFDIVPDAELECFENSRALNEAFTCLNNKLISKSQECIMFISLDRLFTPDDSIFLSKISPPNRPFNPNQIHANNLRLQISSLTKDINNWKNYLRHVESNEVKDRFNADSVIYFHTELKGNMIYESKFNNVISLMIQKKNRGFVNVIIFYTTNSGLNPRNLLDSLKSNIYYRE